MKKITILLTVLVITLTLYAERLNEVSAPTAGVLKKGEAKIINKIYKDNGMIIGAQVGLFDNFMFGFTYGGEDIVGDKKPTWHKNVEFSAKFRIIDETEKVPAIAIGYDSQGHGTYYNELNRYEIKSKGFYLVASKNYKMLGLVGFDLGINQTLERDDKDKDLNLFAGIYKTIGNNLTVMADYDLAKNDNAKDEYHGIDKGYLNAGVELTINEHLSLKFITHDLLENRPHAESFNRSIQINYRWSFWRKLWNALILQ